MPDMAFKRKRQPAVTTPSDNFQYLTGFRRVSFGRQVKLYDVDAKEIGFGCFCVVKLPANLKFDLMQAVRTHCVQPCN